MRKYNLLEKAFENHEAEYIFRFEQEERNIFLSFNSIDNYFEICENFNHCHEIVFPRNLYNYQIVGRIVIDIDAQNDSMIMKSNSNLIRDIKSKFENGISKTLKIHYGIERNKYKFNWLTSENPKKFSKHLIVSGICFHDWVIQLKEFYNLLKCHIRKEIFDVIDYQLPRNNGSLRLPLNSKLSGNILTFDDYPDMRFPLKESEKEIYCSAMIFHRHKDIEKMDEIIEFKPKTIKSLSYDIKNNINSNVKNTNDLNITIDIKDNTENILKMTFKKFFGTNNDYGFKCGPYRDGYLRLDRYRPFRCLISNKIHDHENGYLFCINNKPYFGCYRHCKDHKGSKVKSLSDGSFISICPLGRWHSQEIFSEYLINSDSS